MATISNLDLVCAFALGVALLGCGSSTRGATAAGGSGSGSGGGGAGATAQGGVPAVAGSTAVGAGGKPSAAGQDSGGAGQAGQGDGGAATCLQTSAEAELLTQPVDFIVVVDNSGSMVDQMVAIEDALGSSFPAALQARGLDYRIIVLSRHRTGDRETSAQATTDVCIAAPLSGLAACPAPHPIPAERFFQYNSKIESNDSLDNILALYRKPDARSGLTQLGWSEWLRLGAKKVFVEFSDGDEGGPDDPLVYTAESFLHALVALDSAQFGSDASSPNIVWHSVVGLQEKPVLTDPYAADDPIETDLCTSNGGDVSLPGVVYQELSRRTGGLRFPICQTTAYASLFASVADSTSSGLSSCEFPLPTPAGEQPGQLAPIALAVAGSDQRYGKVSGSAECAPERFYVEGNRVHLCPEACEAVRATGGRLNVFFTPAGCPDL
jgi:hypothetical protein